MSDSIKDYELLKTEIRKHDHSYYVLDNPQISDAEYDSLFLKLVSLEKKYPKLNLVENKNEINIALKIINKVCDEYKKK